MTDPFDLANEGSTEFWSELFDRFERRIVLFTQPLVIAVISSAANFDSLDCLAAVYGDDRPVAHEGGRGSRPGIPTNSKRPVIQ